MPKKDWLILGASLSLALFIGSGVVSAQQAPNEIRGVLLVGKFRTHQDLNKMPAQDQRNTLIVELANRTNQPVTHFQSLDDKTLAGTGAILVFLRETKIRSDADLKKMSDDDLRNIMIVEMAAQTRSDGRKLQSRTNMDLVRMALGNLNPKSVRFDDQ